MVIIRNQNLAFVQKHKWHGSRILTEFSHVFFGGYHKQTSLSRTFRYIITHSYYIALLCWSYINFNFLTRLIHNLLWGLIEAWCPDLSMRDNYRFVESTLTIRLQTCNDVAP